MIRSTIKIVSLLLLLLGLGLELRDQNAEPPPELITNLDCFESPQCGTNQLSQGHSFSLDVSLLQAQLAEVPESDWADQLADWAVYGTLIYERLSQEEIRRALYDKVPLRVPGIEKLVNLDRGPGRRVIVPGDAVWLFYAENDPWPGRTLARLARQVAAELRRPPTLFQVFVYRTDLASGAIDIRKEVAQRSADLLARSEPPSPKSEPELESPEFLAYSSPLLAAAPLKIPVSAGCSRGLRQSSARFAQTEEAAVSRQISTRVGSGSSGPAVRRSAAGCATPKPVPSGLVRSEIDAARSSAQHIVTKQGTVIRVPEGTKAAPAKVLFQTREKVSLQISRTHRLATPRLGVVLLTRPTEGRVCIATTEGNVGALHYERTQGELRLSWENGKVSRDAILLDQLSREPLATESSIAVRTAQTPAAMPTRGLFVIESESGEEAVLLSSRTLASPGAGLSEGPWASRIRATGAGSGARPLEIGGADLQVTAAQLHSTPWQRIAATPDARQSELPARVSRVFSARGPGPGSRSFTLKTSDSRIPAIEGAVEGEILYLRRPQAEAASAVFDELVAREGLSGRYLADAARQVNQATEKLILATPRVSQSYGRRAADQLTQDNIQGALADLNAAARTGQLKSAVDALEQRATAQANTRLALGERSPTARLFRAHGDERGDELLRKASDQLERRKFQEAVQTIETVTLQMRTAPSLVTFGKAARGTASGGAVEDYVRVRTGQYPGVSREVSDKVRLEVAKFRLQTVTNLSRPPPTSKPLSPAERSQVGTELRQQPFAVYVEDEAVLSRLDWDGAPGPTLSQVAQDPRFVWTRIDVRPLGSFRPGALVHGGQRYILRSNIRLAERGSTEGMYVYQISLRDELRSQAKQLELCRDANRDGRIDAAELRRCGCFDVSRDIDFDADQRSHCLGESA